MRGDEVYSLLVNHMEEKSFVMCSFHFSSRSKFIHSLVKEKDTAKRVKQRIFLFFFSVEQR